MFKVIGKVVVSVMGAINTVFSLFTPIAVALMFIAVFPLTGYQADGLLFAGYISSLYRGLKFIIFMENKK